MSIIIDAYNDYNNEPSLNVKLDKNLVSDTAIQLPKLGGLPASYHQFQQMEVDAIKTALRIQRPLLILGDPGLGKSQIAHAIAACMEWNLLVHVVHSRTEPSDLLYRIDHVKRLAQAQLIGAVDNLASDEFNISDEIKKLDEKNYVLPGKFWWAFDPKSASEFYKNSLVGYHSGIKDEINNSKPSVLLIDEIDKADSELPNALLEVLNNKSFQLPVGDKRIACNEDQPPFIVITSNNERELPHAFLRRCVCITLTLASGEKGEEQLIKIAMAHKNENNLENITEELMQKAARLTIQMRDESREHQYRPGTSEFLDLLKAINHDSYHNEKERRVALDNISSFLLKKP